MELRKKQPSALARRVEHTVTIRGDSMLPDLAPGETFHFVPADRVTHDGLYVVRLDGHEMVKQIQRLPGNRLRVSSINPRYASYDLEEDDPSIAILGHTLHDSISPDALFRAR
ncbi:MAG: S24 family peptidase [Rhodothermales bacterium]